MNDWLQKGHSHGKSPATLDKESGGEGEGVGDGCAIGGKGTSEETLSSVANDAVAAGTGGCTRTGSQRRFSSWSDKLVRAT